MSRPEGDDISYVYESPDFTKLTMMVDSEIGIEIANCPDDASLCSFTLKKTDRLVHRFFNKSQVDKIIQALQEVKEDM